MMDIDTKIICLAKVVQDLQRSSEEEEEEEEQEVGTQVICLGLMGTGELKGDLAVLQELSEDVMEEVKEEVEERIWLDSIPYQYNF